MRAMVYIQQFSCIRFLAYDWGADMGQLDYFRIIKSDAGCWATIGRQADKNNVGQHWKYGSPKVTELKLITSLEAV